MTDKIKCRIKKLLKIAGTVIAVLISVAAAILCLSIGWMFDTWSNLSMDELMYHLTAPLEGTNMGMVKEYINLCIAPAILVLLLALVIFSAFRKEKKYYIAMAAGIIVPLAVSGIIVRMAWNKLDVSAYAESQGVYSTFIDDNYISPSDVNLIFPEKKRNLVYIFLESMETTYTDMENGGAFEEDVIPELTALAQENEDFSGENTELNGGYAMPGATWTIAAMFAQTSGIPLNISIEDNSMDTQESFFPGAVTLGDLLKQEGYSQTLMIGSDATFGGRRLYFTEHGNYEIVDHPYACESGMLPEDYRVWWGYEDSKLFSFARQKLRELSRQDEPFNLTLLTVDTHFENGYFCEICENDWEDDQYANVFSCASRQVESFVRWIQRQPFYEDTAIVIVGDHPTMDSNFCDDVDSEYVRKVYTTFINPSVEVTENIERNYTTFDIFPTTLAAMGVEIEGNRLGLGTNLFSSAQTLTERFGVEKEKQEITRKSVMMEELADIKVENVEEKHRPKAELQVEAYREKIGILPVTLRNITDVPNGIASAMIAVWKNEDQSDLQWIQLEEIEKGVYSTYVNMASFAEAEGEYQIHAYVIDEAGGQYNVYRTDTVIK